MIWAGVILFLAAISGNVWYDYRKWRKQLNDSSNLRNHEKGWRLKAISCIPCTAFLLLGSNFVWVVNLIVTLGAECILFNVLFDGFLSLCKKKGFFYLGSKDATHDPHTDRFWLGMPTWMHITLKISLSLLAVYSYYIGTK